MYCHEGNNTQSLRDSKFWRDQVETKKKNKCFNAAYTDRIYQIAKSMVVLRETSFLSSEIKKTFKNQKTQTDKIVIKIVTISTSSFRPVQLDFFCLNPVFPLVISTLPDNGG